MARGSKSREGRAAKSELSDRLLAKVAALRKQNEEEKKEVEATEQEYNDVLEQEYIRIQEEIRKEMKDRKWSVDQEAQERREAEAKIVEAAAKAELAREQVIKDRWTGMNEDREQLYVSLEKPLEAFKPKLLGGKGKNPNLYAPWDFSGTYQNKCVNEAPEEIKSAVRAFFEAHGDGGDGIRESLDVAYKAKLSEDIKIFDPIVEGENQMPKDLAKIPKTREHYEAMLNMENASKYIAKILKNAKRSDMGYDEDGNQRP